MSQNFNLSGKFNYQQLTGVAGAKGLQEASIGSLTGFLFYQVTPTAPTPSVPGLQEPKLLTFGGFLYYQATPVESPEPEPEAGGGGGSVRRRRREEDEIITLMGMLIQSGILDE